MLLPRVLISGLGLVRSTDVSDFAAYTGGFHSPTIVPLAGGHATCIQGNIPVTASAMNTQLKYTGPAKNSVVTETIAEFLQINATEPTTVPGSKQPISGTYNINAQLCFPIGKFPSASSIQFLTHGVGFGKSYWDLYSADYSYQDAAAVKGYTTFAYDRLGVGSSDHPDPIQVVQSALETVIAHNLIQKLRSGAIAGASFKTVIGVGHSFGSSLTNAITVQYPKDLDAAVLTGFTTTGTGFPTFFASLDFVIANTVDKKWGSFPNGYLVAPTSQGNQFAFFRAPAYDPAVFNAAIAAKDLSTIGELFTIDFVAPAPEFTGPIDVVIGENDWAACQGNCFYPVNQAVVVKGKLYPNAAAGSANYTALGAGHGLNAHYAAGDAYAHIFEFIASNNLG